MSDSATKRDGPLGTAATLVAGAQDDVEDLAAVVDGPHQGSELTVEVDTVRCIEGFDGHRIAIGIMTHSMEYGALSAVSGVLEDRRLGDVQRGGLVVQGEGLRCGLRLVGSVIDDHVDRDHLAAPQAGNVDNAPLSALPDLAVDLPGEAVVQEITIGIGGLDLCHELGGTAGLALDPCRVDSWRGVRNGDRMHGSHFGLASARCDLQARLDQVSAAEVIRVEQCALTHVFSVHTPHDPRAAHHRAARP